MHVKIMAVTLYRAHACFNGLVKLLLLVYIQQLLYIYTIYDIQCLIFIMCEYAHTHNVFTQDNTS